MFTGRDGDDMDVRDCELRPWYSEEVREQQRLTPDAFPYLGSLAGQRLI